MTNENKHLSNPLGSVSMIMVTPFTDGGDIDDAALTNYVRWAVNQGVGSVVALGIMGEVTRLSDEERRHVIERTVDAAANDVSVVVGVTSDGTRLAQERARQAESLGAAAVMAAPPRNLRAGVALRDHYDGLADATALDVVVQDEPVTSGVVMPADFIAQLLEHSRIRYVKVEEAPSIPKVGGIMAAAPDALCMGGLGGLYTLEELGRGAIGIMTGFAVPKVLVEVCDLFFSGDTTEARETFYRYLPLIRYEAQLGIGGVAIRKAFLKAQGVITSDHVRAPGASADERTLAELVDIAKSVGALA